MDIFSLVGKSGTGKSFQAISICNDYGIESIIDDGLFIVDGSILAGKSAKRQATKIRAIKTALFTEDLHRDEVVAKIEEIAPKSILVLGTSDKMITQITNRLGLPAPEVRIDIESRTTEDERRLATRYRKELGQHIIPVPTLEVKKEFSGYFLHPLKVLKDIKEGKSGATERSIVRPTFSYMGNYTISDKAIIDITHYAASLVKGLYEASSSYVSKWRNGITIDLGIVVWEGVNIIDVAERYQREVHENVEMMTSMNVLSVDVQIKGLARKEENYEQN
ncbi:MAG: Asp23/Gls24 family envelope stress response protein [Clostridiales Family XIII bacterium]|jgi:uncharacterized alkaline shock family protein YloU|nr:Asp23/Gls24 family envelope stress response protein [Clostridiales Family XIII bacterium]